MKELVEFSNIIETKTFHFKECLPLNSDFFTRLKTGDLFSCHCRDFIRFLQFKRCDKNFRAEFDNFIKNNNLKYVIARMPLTEFVLDNFLNAEQIVKDSMTEQLGNSKMTQRDYYMWLANESGKSFDEIVNNAVRNRRNICGTINVVENKQKLEGSMQGGCWLVLWKY